MRKKRFILIIFFSLLAINLRLALFGSYSFALTKNIEILNYNGQSMAINGFQPDIGYNYIYLGNYLGKPVLWRILYDKTNMESKGMFVMSDSLIGIGNTGQVIFNNTGEGDAWKGSRAQLWATNLFNSAFTEVEKNAVLSTTKDDDAVTISINPDVNFSFNSQPEILKDDKLFFLSVGEFNDRRYGFVNNTSRKLNYELYSDFNQWIWYTRTPYAYGHTNDYVVMIGSDGVVRFGYTNIETPAALAFNLDQDKILFISEAVGGKKVKSSVIKTKEISSTANKKWKLTLEDSSRNTFIAQAGIKTPLTAGDSIEVQYSGAKTGNNEYISAIIVDQNGNAIHYGRLGNSQAEGIVSLTIPSQMSAGEYLIKIFNEQYNGGALDDTLLTDYASRFIDIPLTIGGSTTNNIYFIDSATNESITIKADKNKPYKLPSPTFRQPEGKVFSSWLINGEEYHIGDLLNFEKDTELVVEWEVAPEPTPVPEPTPAPEPAPPVPPPVTSPPIPAQDPPLAMISDLLSTSDIEQSEGNRILKKTRLVKENVRYVVKNLLKLPQINLDDFEIIKVKNSKDNDKLENQLNDTINKYDNIFQDSFYSDLEYGKYVIEYDKKSKELGLLTLYFIGKNDNDYDQSLIDVPYWEWFYEAVMIAYYENWFSNIETNTFSPNEPVTIKMFYEALYILLGSLGIKSERSLFLESSSDNIESHLTREEAISILYDSCLQPDFKYDINQETVYFVDENQISDHYKESIAWAVKSGMIIGRPDGKFGPKDNITKAELASVFNNLVEFYLNQVQSE